MLSFSLVSLLVRSQLSEKSGLLYTYIQRKHNRTNDLIQWIIYEGAGTTLKFRFGGQTATLANAIIHFVLFS